MKIAIKNWFMPVVAISFAVGIDIGRMSETVICGVIALAVGMVALLISNKPLRALATVACVIALGCVMGQIAYHPTLPDEGSFTFRGIIADEVRIGDSESVRTVLCEVTADGKPVEGNVYWSFYSESPDQRLIPGSEVVFKGRLYHPSGAKNPEGYNFKETLLRQGIKVGVYGADALSVDSRSGFSFQGLTASIRHRLIMKCKEALGEEAGGYAATMLFGANNLIPSEDRESFSQLGIAHILSVSGFHVGILSGALLILFRLLKCPQKVRLILYGVILFLYCAVCGFRQPVIRASLLVLLMLFGKILKRPRSGIHLLSFAFLLQLFISPVQLNGLSFQLSFGAVLGITVITPYLQKQWRPRTKVARKVYSGLCAGIGAQAGILYPQLNTFQELPLLGLFLNIPVILIASALIVGYWMALILLPIPFLSDAICAVMSGITVLFTDAVRFLGQYPGITLWTCAPNIVTAIGVVVLMISLCNLFRFKARERVLLASVAVIGICLSLVPEPHFTTEYIQFSIGNADAAVLRDRDQTFVIDTGYNEGVIGEYLHKNRLIPDAVILTHLHADHVSGLKRLMEYGIPIRICYLPEGAESASVHPDVLTLIETLRSTGTEFRYLSADDIIPLASGSIRILWPVSGKIRSGQDANIYPLVLKTDIMGTTLLQMADMDGRYENYIAEPSDILKIAHHGSLSSTSDEFMERVDPQVLLLSCDTEERTEQVRSRFENRMLYSTAENGAVTVRFSKERYTVDTYIK